VQAEDPAPLQVKQLVAQAEHVIGVVVLGKVSDGHKH